MGRSISTFPGPIFDHQTQIRAKSKFPASDHLLQVWLGLGAWCALTGWGLSAIHQLTPLAYAVTAIVTLIAGASLALKVRPPIARVRFPFRRFRRPLPLIYLFLLAGSIVGGLLHAPNNYDMLTYRIPRLLNWLADGRWHWIGGYIDRMDYSGTAWEWTALPLILLTRGTSLVFLINIVSYLFLPGLFFSFLRSLGVSRRMAWTWMWLLPAGLNFVMEAGSGSNDTVAAVYLLAAFYFASRARRSTHAANVFWSIIAAALMTACKASNLPLALPCLVALIPAIPVVKKHLTVTFMAMLVGASVSILPTLIINYHHTRDWAGCPTDPAKLKIHNPLAGLLGNTLQMAAANLQPPVMPFAGKWNAASKHILPAAIDQFLRKNYPRFSLHMGELPQEEQAGLGIGLTLMAAISLAATARGMLRGERKHTTSPTANPWPLLRAGLSAFIVFMAMLGSEAIPRLAAPYYPLLIAPLLLHPIHQTLSHRRWWNICAILAALAVVPGLILTPSRPLFPAARFTGALAAEHPDNVILQRAAAVYKVYAHRAENLAPLRKYLPDDDRVIGIIASADASETALWQPLGSRRLIELTPASSREQARAAGIRYVVVGADGLFEQNITLQDFLEKYGGKVVARESITLKVTEGPEEYFVVKL